MAGHENTSGGTPSSNRFPKQNRLSGHTAADRLFSFGLSFGHYPFRFVYRLAERGPVVVADPASSGMGRPQDDEATSAPNGAATVVFLIGVPKRQVKFATGRNHLKRQMREVIRQNFRTALLPNLPPDTQWEVAILFTGGKNKFSFVELEKKLISGLKRLGDKASKPHPLPPPSLSGGGDSDPA